MALTAYTITIVNKNVAPVDVVGEGYKPIVVISPTGVTTPETPYAEWVSDNTSRLDGSVAIPAWKKLQYFILPATSKLVIATEISDEAIYYQGLVGKFANVEITVTTAPLTVYSIKFDVTELELAVGASSGNVITATTTPAGGTVVWTTSDSDVATVSGGTITAKAVGTAVITGTYASDAGDCVATCTVTVKAAS